MTFPIFRKKDAPQVGMPVKANAKKVEDFAFQPAGTRPHGHHGINDGIVSSEPNAQTHSIAPRNGNQLIVQFKAWFAGIAVDAGGIRKEIELERSVGATALGVGAQKLARHHNRGFAAKFNDLRDSLFIPRAQAFGYSISVFTGRLRHNSNPTGAVYLCQSSAPFFQRYK